MPRWRPSADNDLRRNIEAFAQDDPITAWRTFEAVYRRAEILDLQPDIGRPGRVSGTREFVVTGTPFILVYTQDETGVEILRVLHGRQQWPPRVET